MPSGEETRRFEALLRRRGTRTAGDAEVEREILERYQDDCAVLVLDSSGFTRITQKHGVIHFLSLVVAMRDRVEPILEAHEALSHWAEADNVYAMFSTARAALRSALAIQADLAPINDARPYDERLEVCIGVGAGRLLRIGVDDVFGDEMNLAAKLGEDVAESREVLVTEAVWGRVRDRVSGVDAEPRTVRVGGVDIPYHRLQTTGPVTWAP